jgi:anti-sigma B factor antagonist
VTGEGYELDASREAAIVRLGGELDAHDAPRLRELFARAVDAVASAGTPLLVLDLRALEFLDSTALGTMIGALRRVREAGGEMKVVLPETTARRIFEVTGLDSVLDVRASVDAALDR